MLESGKARSTREGDIVAELLLLDDKYKPPLPVFSIFKSAEPVSWIEKPFLFVGELCVINAESLLFNWTFELRLIVPVAPAVIFILP